MNDDPIAPYEHVVALRTGLAEHFESNAFLACDSMGAVLREKPAPGAQRERLGGAGARGSGQLVGLRASG